MTNGIFNHDLHAYDVSINEDILKQKKKRNAIQQVFFNFKGNSVTILLNVIHFVKYSENYIKSCCHEQ